MALPPASWIFLLFQFAFLCSAQGREVPKSKWRDVNLNHAYDITKPAIDNHFWIYSKQATKMHGDGNAQAIDQKGHVDDIFWIYTKKSQEVAGRGVDGDGFPKREADGNFWIYTKKSKEMGGDNGHHGNRYTDPSLQVFFTVEDLEIGKTMPIYFPEKPDPSKTPQLLPREEAESIPFSSSHLSSLLDYFSFPEGSPQAKAMEYTLKQCELEPIEGEVKFCATSLEVMLDRTRHILGPGTESQALTTTYLSMKNTADPLQNYTVLETPKQIAAPRMIGCHPMPYPYAVFYCHSQLLSENKLFQVSLGGPDGERVEAVAVCHMDTSRWDRDHVSFTVLGIEPGSSPVCHFFPVDSIVWVPLQSLPM